MNQPSTESRGFADWMLAPNAHRSTRGMLRTMLVANLFVVLVGFADWATGTVVSLAIFYLVPVVYAVVRTGWVGGTIVAVASLAVRMFGDFLVFKETIPPAWEWWNASVSFVVFLVVIAILHAHVTLHRQLEERVAERTRALRDAVAARDRIERELRDVAAQERAAIGRDLHDDLGQHLVGIAFAAKVLGEKVSSPDAGASRDAQAIVQMLEESIEKTRGLARGLLLGNIDPAELPNELGELAARGSRSGAGCNFTLQGHPVIDDASTAVQLYRIAQEAMRNALEHGRPTRVDITLSGDENEVSLEVRDNGTGVPAPELRGDGVGLRIMTHRAIVLGGELTVQPRPGQSGTCVKCRVPRRPADPVSAA